jgi:hypothetical protein
MDDGDPPFKCYILIIRQVVLNEAGSLGKALMLRQCSRRRREYERLSPYSKAPLAGTDDHGDNHVRVGPHQMNVSIMVPQIA